MPSLRRDDDEDVAFDHSAVEEAIAAVKPSLQSVADVARPECSPAELKAEL